LTDKTPQWNNSQTSRMKRKMIWPKKFMIDETMMMTSMGPRVRLNSTSRAVSIPLNLLDQRLKMTRRRPSKTPLCKLRLWLTTPKYLSWTPCNKPLTRRIKRSSKTLSRKSSYTTN
jgi:hypothetical protein